MVNGPNCFSGRATKIKGVSKITSNRISPQSSLRLVALPQRPMTDERHLRYLYEVPTYCRRISPIGETKDMSEITVAVTASVSDQPRSVATSESGLQRLCLCLYGGIEIRETFYKFQGREDEQVQE